MYFRTIHFSKLLCPVLHKRNLQHVFHEPQGQAYYFQHFVKFYFRSGEFNVFSFQNISNKYQL